jgi:NitT/TauT family transport system ATP-binding protein
LIAAEGVGMTFEGAAPTLDGVELSIGAGEFVSLVGPSGCGKSTLLRIVAGLMPPTRGRVTLAGQPPVVARQGGQRVAFVFQEPRLLPWRTVVDNIRLPLEFDGAPEAEQRSAVARSLDLIGLTAKDGAKYPAMLSGGMRMRVSLARALVVQPSVLLLDEPFGALDDVLRQQLNEELLRIWSTQRWTAVFITHNVSEAVFLGQRVLVMSRGPGRIVEDIAVPFANREPALRAEPDFARLAGVVSQRLRGEAA